MPVKPKNTETLTPADVDALLAPAPTAERSIMPDPKPKRLTAAQKRAEAKRLAVLADAEVKDDAKAKDAADAQAAADAEPTVVVEVEVKAPKSPTQRLDALLDKYEDGDLGARRQAFVDALKNDAGVAKRIQAIGEMHKDDVEQYGRSLAALVSFLSSSYDAAK